MTANITDLSSSLSGAMDQLLGSLRAAAPPITYSLAGKGSEWYYDLQKRSMVRVPNGTEVIELPKYPPDDLGRIVVQTFNNDVIRVDPKRILKIGFH
jgi:hypothetical protein